MSSRRRVTSVVVAPSQGCNDGVHGEHVMDWSSRVDNPSLETELRLVLTAAIATLPEKYRTVVVLRDVEGLSTQEIAQITGLSVASMNVRTHRARRELRRWLTAFMSDPRPAGNPSSQRSVLRV